MYLLRLLIQTLSLLLFGAFGADLAFAAPGDWVRVSYPVEAQELSAQPVDLTNAARAPPHTSANEMAAGTALAQTGNQRVLDDAEPTGVVYALLRFSIATNRGTWTVDPTFRSADEAAGVLVNGSYIRNPTARNLSDSVTASGKVRVDGQLANGQYMYVVDTSGNIVIGTRGGQRMPHPTLIGGSNPQVQAAGIVDIRGGKIYSVDNASGHFKPGNGSLQNAENAFGNLPGNSFHADF
nr:hypothetical protein [uncultured Celeribacter sp.]